MKKTFVHRYKWSHANKRRRYKKLFRKGKVKLLESSKDGWLYGHLEEWQDENIEPTEPGWYECLAVDGRWNGQMYYRAWGNGSWWIPLKDGWLSSPMGLYKWRGPVADVNGPAPDGTNPK